MSSGSGVQRIEVASPSEFEEALQANKDKASKVFLLFTGERDEDGKSWCAIPRLNPLSITLSVAHDRAPTHAYRCPDCV